MTEEFITPEVSAPAPDKRRRMLLLGGVVLLLLCCCLTLTLAAWYGGDFVVEYLLGGSFAP